MPRGAPRLVRPSRPINTHLDEEWMARVDLLLFSELESRVPKGAYQKFFNERLREFFSSAALDLSPYTGSLPGVQVIRGSAEAIEALIKALQQR